MNTGDMDLIAAYAHLAGVAGTLDAENPVPSPCISVCRMDLAGAACEGCLRTLGEIAGWRQMDEAGKRAVWLQIGQRAATAVAAAGS